MKLSHKSAGLCASGVIVLTTYTAVFKGLEPTDILTIALPGAFVAGFLGYHIGQILSTPAGEAKAKEGEGKSGKAGKPQGELRAPRSVTGNETFLDDLDDEAGLPVTEPNLSLSEASEPGALSETASPGEEESPR